MVDSPTVGDVFGFKTVPLSDFAPRETKRYGSIKILGVDSGRIVISVLDGVFERMPTLEQTRTCNILRRNRFSSDGREAVFISLKECWVTTDLSEMSLLGQLPLSKEDLRRAQSNFSNEAGTALGPLCSANHDIEGEWRWANDRERLLEENEKTTAWRLAKQKSERERYENRLRQLTWEQLLSETPLERWTGRCPFPNEEFTLEARQMLIGTIKSIQALGPKSQKKDTRSILKKCVQWFNEANETHGDPIETEEREDICLILEEIAFVARHKSLIKEIDAWRDW